MPPKSQSKAAPPAQNLSLTNIVGDKSGTLVSFVRRAVRASSGRGSHRHLYVLSCYFDLPALKNVTAVICDYLKKVGGEVTGITIAIDVSDWIRCRLSVDMLIKEVAMEAGVPPTLIKIFPVQFPGQLLHAKAYAAIRPGDQAKTGFVVVTSGNATQRGLGLAEESNLELATTVTDSHSLAAFEKIMGKLAQNRVSEETAMKHDRFLRALALFTSGVFYHRWQGSLSTEIRFKLTLTAKGRKARKENAADFRGYESDSDTISRDPLNIENVFKKAPKPFPPAFWRTYSVDTLLGYWLPGPIAHLVDQKLRGSVEPYMRAIQTHTSTRRVSAVVRRLKANMIGFGRKKLVKENSSVVNAWRERVIEFREDKELISLRVHPYTRVPDLINGETRHAVLEARDVLIGHLDKKKRLSPIKGAIHKFFLDNMTLVEFDLEWNRLAKLAAESLE